MTDTELTESRPEHPRARAALALADAIAAAPRGDRADLRRGGRRALAPFYKVSAAVLADVIPSGPSRDEWERRWMLIAQLFAMLGPSLLKARASLGRALSAAGVAEMRVLRLLRAEGDDLEPLLRHTVHQLDSSAEPACPIQLAELVLAIGPGADRIRRQIASDYYAAERAAD